MLRVGIDITARFCKIANYRRKSSDYDGNIQSSGSFDLSLPAQNHIEVVNLFALY